MVNKKIGASAPFFFFAFAKFTLYIMKGVIIMILFTILLGIITAIAIIAVITAIAAGAGFIAVFGDVIVFGLIIWLIIKIFRRKK